MAVLIQHLHIDDFLKANKEFLLQTESFYNLPLGLSLGIQNGTVEPDAPLYFSLLENGRSKGCALRSHAERPIILTEMPAAGIEQLISALHQNKVQISAVMGTMNSVNSFQTSWCKQTSMTAHLQMHLGVYECKAVNMPAITSEKLIKADISHSALLNEFIRGFLVECFPEKPVTESDVQNLLNRQLKEQTLFLLQNAENEIVSMAANSRGGVNSGSISLVYTPPRHRKKGHAGKTVALLSEQILKSGKTLVNLFTDLKNPTSNSVYQKIGFTKIGEQLHYQFTS